MVDAVVYRGGNLSGMIAVILRKAGVSAVSDSGSLMRLFEGPVPNEICYFVVILAFLKG